VSCRLAAPAVSKGSYAEEITAAGGTVSDTLHDGCRLFTRSILPSVREVRASDHVQGGVALKATERAVWVHPYVFRQVCRNGAIMAHAIETRLVEADDFPICEEAAVEVRAGIQACAADDPFSAAAAQMRSAGNTQTNMWLRMLPSF